MGGNITMVDRAERNLEHSQESRILVEIQPVAVCHMP